MQDTQQLIAELREYSICQLADALGTACPIETGLRPIDPQSRICGTAFTVECSPGDNLTVHQAIYLARPGDVLIVTNSENAEPALWGELMTMSAQSKGLAGTIVEGPVRDSLEIRKLQYPVFCREFNPRRAAKEKYGRVNVPVRLGAVVVNPGDVVLADVNGMTAIPAASVDRVVPLTAEVARKETAIKDQILSGRTIFEILELGRYLPPTAR